MNLSFEFCATHFLIQWMHKEQHFHNSMSGQPSVEMLRKALKFFVIARNFKDIKTAKVSKKIIDAMITVDAHIHPTMEQKVLALASKFKTDFGKNNLSAASKILWMRNRSPYIIYDSRAVNGLKQLGHKFDKSDYVGYCIEWRNAFAASRDQVVRSVRGLHFINRVMPNWPLTREETRSLVGADWFLERVFDIYLYQLGGE